MGSGYVVVDDVDVQELCIGLVVVDDIEVVGVELDTSLVVVEAGVEVDPI